MPVDLRKVRNEAPHLLKKVQNVNRVSLEKGLRPGTDQAAVMATIDSSLSARGLYESGEMQGVCDLSFATGLVFDDDGKMPVSLFDNRAYDLGEITLSNCEGFIEKQRKNWGGTSYVAALKWIIETAGYGHINLGSSGSGGMFRRSSGDRLAVKATAKYPTYAIFITDGDPQDGPEAEQLLIRMSQLPIFVQFLGVGRYEFQYLRRLDELDGRLVDNANFFDAKTACGDETAMLNGMLNELPGYLKAARSVGLITG